jgi:hypothetical protein
MITTHRSLPTHHVVETAMPLTFARRGHCVFRHLSLRVTDPVSARVSPVPSYFRRVSQLTSLRPHYLATLARSSTNRFIVRKTYATAASRPKAHTGKAKAGAGPKKATKSTTAKESTSRAKKQLTPKQKEKKDAEKRTADIKELKEISLKEPKALPRLAWSLFVADKLKGSTTPVKERLKAVVSQYRSLSEDELEVSVASLNVLYCSFVCLTIVNSTGLPTSGPGKPSGEYGSIRCLG